MIAILLAQVALDPNNFEQVLGVVADAITRGAPVSILVPAILVLIVHVLRMGVGALPESWTKLKTAFSHPFVLWLLPTIVSVAGGALTVAVGGGAITLGVVVKAVLLGLAANGAFNGVRKAQEGSGVPVLTPLPTKTEAIDTIKKVVGPPAP